MRDVFVLWQVPYKSYCYDRKEDKEIKEQLNDALHVSGLEIHIGNVSAA